MNPLPEVLAGRLLVGPALGWPYGDDPAAATRFLQVASRHGVQALLHQRLRRGEVWPSWPAKVRDTLSGARAAEITREHLRHGELLTVLEAMARRGLSPLLLKGAALAHTHYVTPELRRRGDTDMLIRPRERIVAREVLRDLGYQPLNLTSGSFVSYQFSVSKVDALGLQHAVDVHWRLSNRQVFGTTLSYDELAAAAVSVGDLAARAPAPVHALLLACMHRATHFGAPFFSSGTETFGDRLIWLYDIHLLVTAMTAAQSEAFSRLAADRGMGAVCLDGLRRAESLLGTVLPEHLVAALSDASAAQPGVSPFTHGRLGAMVHDLRTLPRWTDRLRLVCEHLFPPAEYMRRKYHRSGRVWLPLLYSYRIVRGGWSLVRQQVQAARPVTDARVP